MLLVSAQFYKKVDLKMKNAPFQGVPHRQTQEPLAPGPPMSRTGFYKICRIGAFALLYFLQNTSCTASEPAAQADAASSLHPCLANERTPSHPVPATLPCPQAPHDPSTGSSILSDTVRQ